MKILDDWGDHDTAATGRGRVDKVFFFDFTKTHIPRKELDLEKYCSVLTLNKIIFPWNFMEFYLLYHPFSDINIFFRGVG